MSLKKGSVMTVVHPAEFSSLTHSVKTDSSEDKGLLWMGMPFRLTLFLSLISLLWLLIWMMGLQA